MCLAPPLELQIPEASCNPGYCVAGWRYTTEGTKTHKTGCRRVVYAWHPLCGRDLSVIGTMNRHGEVMLVCRVEEHRAPLEIPAWMFDAAACCHCTSASTPREDIESLT